jgi:acetolactate synthase-1/2/3 large subunit
VDGAPAPTSRPSPRRSASLWRPSFRCQDYIDNASPAYAGHAGLGMDPALARAHPRGRRALAIGGRLGEIPSDGYTLVRPPVPGQRLVHVHPDPDELGAVYQPELGIVSASSVRGRARRCRRRRVAARRTARGGAREYGATLRAPRAAGPLQLSACMAALRERLPPDAILTNGAGNFSVWAHRFYEFHRYPRSSRRAAARWATACPRGRGEGGAPDRPVVCMAGDGDFLMTGQELATAVQEELPVVFLVVNNGDVRDDPHAPGAPLPRPRRRHRSAQPRLRRLRPRFGATARSSSAPRSSRRRSTRRSAAAARAARLRVDPQAITPRQTLDEIRAAAT